MYQQLIASLSLESSQVKEDPSPGRDNVFVSVSHSCDKTSRLRVETKRCWTPTRDIILEWEQRKKSRVGGGAFCEFRDVSEKEKSSSVAGVRVTYLWFMLCLTWAHEPQR